MVYTFSHPSLKKNSRWQKDAHGKKSSEKPFPEKKRFCKNESIIKKKKKFGKKRRTRKEDLDKKLEGIISETVSHIIDNKKEENEKSPKKSAVGSGITF